MSSGRKTTLASVGGMALGSAIAMGASLAGVGALLAASAIAFTILKWTGALYLIAIGLWTLLRSTKVEATAHVPPEAIAPRVAFANHIAIGTFHPKTIVLFVAFVPQFITPQRDYVLQCTILIVTFCAVVATTDCLYALAAARATQLLRGARARIWSKRGGGLVLIGAGAVTAAVHQ